MDPDAAAIDLYNVLRRVSQDALTAEHPDLTEEDRDMRVVEGYLEALRAALQDAKAAGARSSQAAIDAAEARVAIALDAAREEARQALDVHMQAKVTQMEALVREKLDALDCYYSTVRIGPNVDHDQLFRTTRGGYSASFGAVLDSTHTNLTHPHCLRGPGRFNVVAIGTAYRGTPADVAAIRRGVLTFCTVDRSDRFVDVPLYSLDLWGADVPLPFALCLDAQNVYVEARVGAARRSGPVDLRVHLYGRR